MKKRRNKNSITPLLLGISGILGSVLMIAIGSLVIGGQLMRGGQIELLALSERGLPYLKAAEIAAKNNDFILAEKLLSETKVLGMSTEQEKIIRPENVINDEIVSLEEQVKKTPSAYLYLKLAYNQYRIKRFSESRESVEKASKIAPNDPEIESFRVWLLARPEFD